MMDVVGYMVILSHFGHITMVSLFIRQKNKTTIAFLKY